MIKFPNLGSRNRSKKNSFTLIEMLISIGLLALVLTSTGGVLLSVVKSFQKQSALQQIERNGDLVLRTIEERVRKSKTITTKTVDVIVGSDTYKYNMLTLISSADDSVSYIGVARRSPSSGVYINYFFVKDGGGEPNSFPNIPDSESNKYKVSNDNCSTGVNIILKPNQDNYLTLYADPGLPIRVSARIELELANCNSNVYRATGLSKVFDTFVTARGTY